ncbi:hypothetical protein NDI85_13680 [Halomicroarcula sp. S1AR25-4]|uniref:hypothetical protein n=1 Tax=Haloarcula sp. S1AR25-4 TaxID=2950538 RepID=UPI002876A8F7|nr:hypothetical protein [Halomicroarcula sp. S1AR25-4]MDS0278845.1 hypothetical protein [Halomicroarcula sp. S1AR25-4]
MDRRGIAETVGAALVSGGLAVVGLWLFADYVDWVLVVGLVACVAIATAANYRARTGHAENVAAEAPAETADNYEGHTQTAAGDGGTVSDDWTRDGPADAENDRVQ